MKFNVLLACAVLALTVSACRKKPVAPAPEPPAPANAANALEMAYSNATALTMGLQEFMAKNGRAPSDVNELVTAKLVQKIPPLPLGYKYEIDAKRKQVVVSKQ
jgi:hypothetical protein